MNIKFILHLSTLALFALNCSQVASAMKQQLDGNDSDCELVDIVVEAFYDGRAQEESAESSDCELEKIVIENLSEEDTCIKSIEEILPDELLLVIFAYEKDWNLLIKRRVVSLRFKELIDEIVFFNRSDLQRALGIREFIVSCDREFLLKPNKGENISRYKLIMLLAKNASIPGRLKLMNRNFDQPCRSCTTISPQDPEYDAALECADSIANGITSCCTPNTIMGMPKFFVHWRGMLCKTISPINFVHYYSSHRYKRVPYSAQQKPEEFMLTDRPNWGFAPVVRTDNPVVPLDEDGFVKRGWLLLLLTKGVEPGDWDAYEEGKGYSFFEFQPPIICGKNYLQDFCDFLSASISLITSYGAPRVRKDQIYNEFLWRLDNLLYL